MTNTEMIPSEAMLERAVAVCHEMRGEDLVVLDVRELVEYMDYLVIVTGRSDRQNRAIAERLISDLKKAGVLPLSRAGMDHGSWICIDLVDVVVHLFTPETRQHYDLELLWADAKTMDVEAPENPVGTGGSVGAQVEGEAPPSIGDVL